MDKEQFETIKDLLEENNALLSKLIEIFEDSEEDSEIIEEIEE